jgi:membrane-bound lytic murein transglycosylase A
VFFGRVVICVACLAGAAVSLPLRGESQTPAASSRAGGAFSTRLGTFTPQPWSALSGWSRESHAEALDVFRQTCRSLQRRDAWRAACASAGSAGGGADAARAFFEREFVPYLVTAKEPGREGLMTGYFEPILKGSPVRKPPFSVPVHGVPADLLYLDARRWQGVAPDGSVRAAVVGGQVVPATASEPGLAVDRAVFDSEPLDRRHRVRREGDRIVPYWTRQQIDAGAAIDAKVIAWVDDAQAFYLMQVQGSGQIRMPDGKTIRLSYSDQNGHPFRPRGATPGGTRTRSLPGTDAPAGEPVAVATPVTLSTLSLVQSGPARRKAGGAKGGSGKGSNSAGGSSAGSSDAGGNDKAGVAKRGNDKRGGATATGGPANDIDRIVDSLLAQPSRAKPDPGAPVGGGGGSSTGAGGGTGGSGGSGGSSADADARTTANLGYLVAAREKDPSYVFFEPAASGGSGPVGALGVPLTATRSIAVDPRSTPLGAPVFIEAERDDSPEPLRRLMIAQDTGGAIRGAVRADFFWGTGPKAGAQAVRTRDDLAMWVLLPKDFSRPKAPATRTRGVGSGPAATAAECVMPDNDYCLE